jgi:hypothetical protein
LRVALWQEERFQGMQRQFVGQAQLNVGSARPSVADHAGQRESCTSSILKALGGRVAAVRLRFLKTNARLGADGNKTLATAQVAMRNHLRGSPRITSSVRYRQPSLAPSWANRHVWFVGGAALLSGSGHQMFRSQPAIRQCVLLGEHEVFDLDNAGNGIL